MTDAKDVGIDHLMVGTPDLEVTYLKLQRLGFNTTPRGFHESLGTANHTALFADRSYLEILGIVTPGPANASYRAAIDAVGEGIAGLALRTSSAAEFHELASESGLEPDRPLDFDRRVGEAGCRARFSIVRLPAETLPPLSLFACQHHTPDLVWLADYMIHPNCVTGIAAVAFADPVGRGAQLFSRLTRRPACRDGETIIINAGPMELLFAIDLASAKPIADEPTQPVRVRRVAFFVSDVAKAQKWFERQDVVVRSSGTRLSVPASEAFGFTLDFAEPPMSARPSQASTRVVTS